MSAEPQSLWPQPTSLRRAHRIAGVILLIVGIVVVEQALRLRYYTSLGPGPGFFPFWLGLALSVLAAIMIIRAHFGQPEPAPQDFFADARGYRNMATIVFGLLLAVIAMKPLGFAMTLAIAVCVFLRLTGGHSWLTSLLGALVGGFGTYLLFARWLGVPLPAGPFGF